jgi:hypothetical protein
MTGSRDSRLAKNETYKILDIAWDTDPNLPFTKYDGTRQTLHQYYRQVKMI